MEVEGQLWKVSSLFLVSLFPLETHWTFFIEMRNISNKRYYYNIIEDSEDEPAAEKGYQMLS